MSGDNTRAGEAKALKHEQIGYPVSWMSRWLPTAKRKYGMFLVVVCVTALASATLFSFAGMTQQDVRLKYSDNVEDVHVDDAQEESMEVIRKAFEESGNDQQHAPSKFAASSSINLLCRFSPRYRAGVYPYGVCSHFIYASVPSRPGPHSPSNSEVLYNYDPGAFKKFLHVRETAGDVRLLLSVELKAMLHTGWSAQKLASDARVWLERSGVDGLHLAGLDLLPRNVQNITDIVTALRDSFKQRFLITIGIDRTQKTVESELLKILTLVDFASFKTSYVRHTDERTTLTNPYSKYDNSTSSQFLNHEIDKLTQLAARSPKSHLCFTLTLGGNQFQLRDSGQHGLGAAAKHIRDASYAEICKRQWNEVKYIEPAIGYYARSGNTWVGYDTEKTIAAKVRLALRKHPDLCVMLVQVDKDDIRGICAEKHFPLVQSVKHAMRLYHREPPARDGQVGRATAARSGRE